MATVKLHENADRSDLPLVLLPPFPLDARLWDGVVARLSGNVVTVDPPGFGEGTADDQPSLEGYARALAVALDDRGHDRVVLAGNSMGGYAALAFAELFGARIAGIGLVGTKAAADSDEPRQARLDMAAKAHAGAPAQDLVGPMIERMLAPATLSDQPEVAQTLRDWLAAAPVDGIAWGQTAMAARPDRLAVLKGLDVPAAVVHGSEDPTCTAQDHQAMADALGVQVQTVPGRGHLVPLEDPGVVAEALRQLWARARADA